MIFPKKILQKTFLVSLHKFFLVKTLNFAVNISYKYGPHFFYGSKNHHMTVKNSWVFCPWTYHIRENLSHIIMANNFILSNSNCQCPWTLFLHKYKIYESYWSPSMHKRSSILYNINYNFQSTRIISPAMNQLLL